MTKIFQKIKNYIRPVKQTVYTPDGTKNIADVKVGDILLGAHGAKNEVKGIEILNTKEFEKSCIEINNGDLYFAKRQNVYVNGKCRHADDIKIGDKLQFLAGTDIEVKSVRKIKRKLTFYKFDITGDHSYYINGILVHNASRYWVGGTGNWDASTTTHWGSTSGTADNASVPGTGDDVFFDSLSNEPGKTAYTCTATATGNCANLDVSFTGTTKVTIAGTSYNLNVYGNLNFSGGTAQITWTHTGGIVMKATSGTKTMTFGGVQLPNNESFNMNGVGGTFQLLDELKLGFGITLSAGTFDANGQTVSFNTGTCGISSGFTGSSSFYNLTRTGTGIVSATMSLSGNVTVTNVLTINGNAANYRVLVSSNTIGTQRTITAASIVTKWADYKDIIGAGAADWNLKNQGTDSSGDCGGNTNITFTDAVDQHWTNVNGGSWLTAANWTSRMPLPQDNVFMDCAFGTSKTVTADASRLGKSIDFTGATWTTALTFTLSTTTSIFGSLKLIDGLTLGTGTTNLTFEGRGSYVFNPHSLTFDKPIILNAPTGTLTLNGNLTMGATRQLSITNGTFSCVDGGSNYILSVGLLVVSSGTTITLGSATHLINGTTGTLFDGNGTITSTTCTLKFTGVLTANSTIQGRSKIYGNFWNNTTGTYYLTLNGSNTWADFKVDAGRTMKFENGSTQYPTTTTMLGTSGSHILLQNASGTTAFHFSKASGNVVGNDYLELTYADATGGALWFAGSHSTNTVGSTGWRYVDLKTTDLTEALTTTASLTNLRGKTFVEAVQVVSSKIFITGRTFALSLTARPILTIPQFREFLESLTTSSVFVKMLQAKKTLTEAIAVNPIFSRVLTTVRVLTQAISVSSVKVAQTGKIFVQSISVVSSRLVQTTKLLTEAITASPVFAKVGTFNKILSEALQVASSRVGQISRNFIEQVSVTSERVASVAKTFTESVSAVSASIYSTAKTFLETITLASVYAKVWTLARTLVEQIKVVGDILKNTGRTISEAIGVRDPAVVANSVFLKTITETINVVSAMGNWVIGKMIVQPIGVAVNFLTASTFAKTLSEALQVSGKIIQNIGKVLSEIVLAIGQPIFTSVRILYETIKVAGSILKDVGRFLVETITATSSYQRVLTASRTLTETVKVAWSRVGQMAKTFKESVSARVASFNTQKVKILLETIIGSTNWLFEKTQFIILTDALTVASKALKSTGRIFVQSIRVAGGAVYQTAKTFVETITTAISFLGAKAYEFLEAIGVAGALSNWSIGKLLKENVNVGLWFNEGRNKIFTEVVQVVGSFKGAATKLLTETLQIATNLTRSIGRILTQAVKMADTTVFRKKQYKVLSDAISASAGAFNKAGKTFGEALAVVSSMGNWVIGKVIVQPVKVVGTYVKAWTLSRVFVQSITVAGDAFNQGGKIFVEALGVAEQFAKTLLGIIRYEFIQVSHTLTRSMPKVFSETINIVGSLANQTGKIFVEAITIAGQFVLGTISKLLKEAISAVAVLTKAGTFKKVLSEAITISTSFITATGRVFAEAVQVAGNMAGRTMARTFAEVVKVSSAITQAISRTFKEAINLVGNVFKRGGKIFTGNVGVSGALQRFNIGLLLKETVNIMVKTKYVLNGIAVGLWRKVARITTGAWRKVGRKEDI